MAERVDKLADRYGTPTQPRLSWDSLLAFDHADGPAPVYTTPDGFEASVTGIGSDGAGDAFTCRGDEASYYLLCGCGCCDLT